jgi:acetyltransferase-like isoleucine patch superfamily enzyme
MQNEATISNWKKRDLRQVFVEYGAVGVVRLAIDVIRTKIRFPNARIIRSPAEIRGKDHIRIGKNFTSGSGLRLEALGSTMVISIGDDVQVNDQVHIAAVQSVSIGNRVLIASKVFISDHNHGVYSGERCHSNPLTPPALRSLLSAPVIIEDDVWIGEFVSVLPGTRIGRGSVIGTQSVVNREIPPYCVAVGSPARVIKRFDFGTGRWQPV